MTDPQVSVSEFIQNAARYDIEMHLLAGGGGLSNVIRSPRIQKPGLALAGFQFHIHKHRVQILGETEVSFLRERSVQDRLTAIDTLLSHGVACITVTKGLEVPAELVRRCDETRTPLLRSTLVTNTFVDRLLSYLKEILAQTTSVHGVMLDVIGVGILLTGESGIGKSESALDLILRGHRLVADDVVEFSYHPPSTLIARGAEAIRHHMEVRGLGIINIKDLYGVAAIRETKKLELVVELVPWDAAEKIERIGLDRMYESILGVSTPKIQLPVSPGRNISSIIEVAARNHLLKLQGIDSAHDFQQAMLRRLAERAPAMHDAAAEDTE